MIFACPGCGEIHDDAVSEYCDPCFSNRLGDRARERSTHLAHLLAPRIQQRDYLVRTIELLEDRELVEIVMRVFQHSSPIERSQLMDIASAVAGLQKFADGKREKRRCR